MKQARIIGGKQLQDIRALLLLREVTAFLIHVVTACLKLCI